MIPMKRKTKLTITKSTSFCLKMAPELTLSLRLLVLFDCIGFLYKKYTILI